MCICPSVRFPACVTLVMLLLGMGNAFARHGELPNRIPEAAPYNVDEAAVYPPPYEEKWATVNTPALCATCHTRIFQEWNGSMMANSWRDPGWRGAFLLLGRLTATDGNCDIPNPPDGTPKAQLNPFANADCSSTFNLGTTTQTTTGSGSLLDDFCARCHMPTNYVDQVTPTQVQADPPRGWNTGWCGPPSIRHLPMAPALPLPPSMGCSAIPRRPRRAFSVPCVIPTQRVGRPPITPTRKRR